MQDMPTLAGNYPEVCFAKYGSMPVRGGCGGGSGGYVHEMSLRILLHAIDAAANKYKRHIEPWLALSVDFYVRVFVRVRESPAEVKRSSLKRCLVLQSAQCPSFRLQPLGQVQPGKRCRDRGTAAGGRGGRGRGRGQAAGAATEKEVVEAEEQQLEEEEEAKEKFTSVGVSVCATETREGGGKDVGKDVGVSLSYSAAVVGEGIADRCEFTGGRVKVGGPIWSHVIHDQAVVDQLLLRVKQHLHPHLQQQQQQVENSSGSSSSSGDGDGGDRAAVSFMSTARRMEGVLTCISEELKDVPLYYCLPDLFAAVQASTPASALVYSALRNAGYRVSQFHHEPTAVKTDAPPSVVPTSLPSYLSLYPLSSF